MANSRFLPAQTCFLPTLEQFEQITLALPTPKLCSFAIENFLPKLISPPLALGNAETRSRTDCFIAAYSFFA